MDRLLVRLCDDDLNTVQGYGCDDALVITVRKSSQDNISADHQKEEVHDHWS